MKVIDVDPEVLQKSAAARVHAAEQSWTHIDAECKDVVDEVVDTLVDDGRPLAYLVLSQVLEDGSVKLPFSTDVDGIRQAYDLIHSRTQLMGIEAATEVRGEWYTFFEGIAPSTDKATGTYTEHETMALFPSTTVKGITGELVWGHKPLGQLGLGNPGSTIGEPVGPEARREVLRRHERYLSAFRRSDIEAILAEVSDDAQTAIRDYVNDTGTLTALESKDALRSYYRAFFDKYDLVSVDLLQRVAREWYAFSELRVTVSPRGGPAAGQTLAFNTAEYFGVGHDGRFLVRIGHGTDPA